MKIICLALIELEVYNAPRAHTLEVCENFSKLGHDVLLLIPMPRNEKQVFSFRVVYVPYFGWGFFRELLYNSILSFYFMYFILKFKPDVVYERMLENPFCSFIAKLFGISAFHEVNGPPFQKGAILQNIFTALELRKTSGIIAPSQKLKQLILSATKLKEEKVCCIPNGVNPAVFFPQEKQKARQKLGLLENGYYIGYTGAIHPSYDFDFIFKTMKKLERELKNAKLVIIAPHAGGHRPENIIFKENIRTEEIPPYINAFDVCLLPLSKYGMETQNITARVKLFEYIACGKTVLAPKHDEEEIPDEFKPFIVFYKYGDENDFIEKIKELYSKRNLMEDKKENINAFIEEYSWRKTTGKIVHFLRGQMNQGNQ